ncbi:MAG: peptide deformylase [Puniceicoccaceae bacterium]
MLRITHYGESVLTRKGTEITVFDEALLNLADAMVDTMYEADGIGLAAQQIDQPIMLCVVDVAPEGAEVDFAYELDGKTPPIDLIMPMALVNPRILKVSEDTDVLEEGCLSFPGIRGEVRRPLAIEVTYQDLEGASHNLKCDGILARCIQHEVDHLNGILFTDRMDSKTRKSLKTELRELKEATLASIPSVRDQ